VRIVGSAEVRTMSQVFIFFYFEGCADTQPTT
jgi:hypothetical protein